MKKLTNFNRKSRMAFSLALIFILLSQLVDSQTFKLFGVSDMVRVYEDGYKLPPQLDTIKMFGIRGEILSGQLAVFAKKSIPGVTVELSGLKNMVSGAELPATAVSWNFVGSIGLSKNTPNQQPVSLDRIAPAKYPEYLMREKQISIKEKSYQPVWITVKLPQQAISGIYSGSVTVICNNESQTLPVAVTVFPLTMPVERHLKVTEWYSTSDFERFHGIKEEYSPEWFAMLRIYAENMAEHRQNIFRVPMEAIEIGKSNSGNLVFDFRRFDQIAQVFWDTKRMDGIETGFLANFGEKEWFSTDIVLKDFKITDLKSGEKITMKGEDVVPSLIPAFESHLREKGWLNKTLFHIRDEPSVHNALAWREMSTYFHKLAPGLIRGDAIETTFLLDDIEIAIPKLDALATWYDSYKKWKDKGHELWFYTVGIYQASLLPDKTIDMPVIDSRLMHWLNYKYDATGYLHWGWNQWTNDPYQDMGENFGDAWHVYPVKDGVLNSLRWEEMRNGIQDYEYFWMLENKIQALKDSLGSRFSWIEPGQRGKEIAGEVIKGFADHTDDPVVLNRAKMKLIDELLQFDKSPRIYIQTNPPAGSTLTNHSSVEVLGWAEPGTKIVINGKEIPVSYDGLFLEQFGGEFIDPTKIHLGDKILIQVTGTKGSKTINREFIIR